MPAADRGHETVLDPGVRDGRALYPRRNHAARPGDGEPNDDDAAFEIALARKALLIAVPGLADMTAGGATNDLLVDRPADFRLTDDDVWKLATMRKRAAAVSDRSGEQLFPRSQRDPRPARSSE